MTKNKVVKYLKYIKRKLEKENQLCDAMYISNAILTLLDYEKK